MLPGHGPMAAQWSAKPQRRNAEVESPICRWQINQIKGQESFEKSDAMRCWSDPLILRWGHWGYRLLNLPIIGSQHPL